MTRANELDMIFEARRDGFGTVRIAFDKFDNLLFFFLFPPGVEGIQIFED